MFRYLEKEKLDIELAFKMLPVLYEYPKMDFDSVLTIINYKRMSKKDIVAHITFLKNKFSEIKRKDSLRNEVNWIMGELRPLAIGNMPLKELSKAISNEK